MVEVSFCQLQPWALVPNVARVDRKAAREERDVYQQHFRYKRVTRLPADCPPWVLGQELGWLVRSPVAVAMGPVGDIEFDVPQDEELRAVARKINRSEVWRRDDGWIATQDTDWMRFYDYRSGDRWESMFLPNGSGTVEWRLGWGIRIPPRYFIMVMGLDAAGLGVPVSVVAAKTANAMAERGGFSIAIQPTRRLVLKRGDPVARLVLLHTDSLQSSTVVESSTTVVPVPDPPKGADL